MNKTAIYALAVLGLSVPAMQAAQAPQAEGVGDVRVSDVRFDRSGQFMDVSMTLGLDSLDVASNRALLITPAIVNGADTLTLPAVGVYGRTRYYYYQRQYPSGMISGADEVAFRSSDRPAAYEYTQVVPYADWMDGADLVLSRQMYGCCRHVLAAAGDTVDSYIGPWQPEPVYVFPKGEREKTYSIEGSAFIEFPVNRTIINADYRSNPVELGKIVASIDSVRNDKDVTINGIDLKGYASPEGKWDYNARLAEGRTAALKEYVNKLYHFPAGVIHTASEPEDWAGLRSYVAKSNLPHRAEILEVIDSDLLPDAKEWRIKSSWPDDYAFLLANVYPALRHTDYRIAYTVRRYTDIEDVKRVLATRPQYLSINELYLLAGEYEPGTDEFTEVYETAVRMFPDDEMANLNAVNAALLRHDVPMAEKYIERAGKSPEALYARGALEIARNNYPAAIELFRSAAQKGLPQAKASLAEAERRMKFLERKNNYKK